MRINRKKFINENITSFVKKIKSKSRKDIWICGGVKTINQLVSQNLIDEYHITIIPIILGNGIRLFQENNIEIKLKLKESNIENGIITNIYSKR